MMVIDGNSKAYSGNVDGVEDEAREEIGNGAKDK